MNTQPHHYEVGGDPAVASCMALWRKLQDHPDVVRALAAKPLRVVGAPKTADRAKMIRKKAARITEKEKAEMNRLYYDEKLTLAQVAAKLGISFPCVWNHVRRIKKHANK